MKIVFLMSSFNMGGAEKHALSLADFYSNHLGWDTEVWAWYEKSGRVKEVCEEIGVKTIIIPPFNNFRKKLYALQVKKYANIFKEAKVDVIMSFNNKPNILSAAIWKKAGVKLHIWAQQGIDIHTKVFQSDLERKFLANVNCVISNSYNGKRFLESEHGLNPETVNVVQNGIKIPSEITPKVEWKKRLGLQSSENHFVAGMIANLTYMKDHVTLVKAWFKVKENLQPKGVEPLLFFAGRVDVAGDEIINLIQELGLTRNVFCLGAVKDVTGFANILDLAILSSPTEGVPNAVLETMVLGKPFVGTAIDGIKEAVGENNYKYLSKEKDADGLAEKILLFAENKKLSLEVGQENRDDVLERFNIEKLWKETHSIVVKKLAE